MLPWIFSQATPPWCLSAKPPESLEPLVPIHTTGDIIMKRRVFIHAGVAAATLASPMLHAQTLPSGSVRIVVGFPPGGGTDALARVVGQDP